MNRQSGDTLVEVLIAIAILSLAIVAGLGMMNFGFGVVLNSIQRTQVQADMSSQIAMVRYARDAYVKAGRPNPGTGASRIWRENILGATSVNSESQTCSGTAPFVPSGSNPFYLSDTSGGVTFTSGVTRADAAPTPGRGLWVEAEEAIVANVRYIDVYVKACWTPVAGSTPQEAKSVVRLYVP